MRQVYKNEDLLSEVIRVCPSFEQRLAILNPSLSAVVNKPLTLAAAANIAGVDEEAFVAFINCGATVMPDSEEIEPSIDAPNWVSRKMDTRDLGVTVALDVRPIVASGVDPLSKIMEKVRTLSVGDRFILDAPFDPRPLKGVLKGMGFENFTEQCAAEHWRIYFRRKHDAGNQMGAPTENMGEPGPNGFSLLDPPEILDVRGLEPPGPLVAIVQKLEEPDTGDHFFVRIHREPIYLHPELNERGWRCDILSVEDNQDGGQDYLLKISKHRVR